MHLLKGQPRGLIGAAEPVDLEQSPGDIVILSAADTEISGLAAARRALPEPFPSVRLANWMALAHPYSVDLYGEKVLAHTRLIAIRLLGGASYWRYGLDEAARLARGGGARLLVMPGDATWDAALAREGTVDEATSRKVWSYLVEGGSENLVNALRFCAHLIGEGEEPEEAKALPGAGYYRDALSKGFPRPLPTAAIVFYRALVQAGQTDPVDTLCDGLAAGGFNALPIFVSSLMW
jgi:cobaltochelatase CobN